MEQRILISGTGGQGVIAAGEFLSEALFRAGYEVANTRSYGAEARGGSSQSFVLVSDGEIYDLELGEVDILIAMSVPACRRYLGRAKKDALVLIEDEALQKLGRGMIRRDVRLVSVSASETATTLGNPIVANMVMLGALSKLSGLLKLELLKESVKTLMRVSMHDINLKALEAGYATDYSNRLAFSSSTLEHT